MSGRTAEQIRPGQSRKPTGTETEAVQDFQMASEPWLSTELLVVSIWTREISKITMGAKEPEPFKTRGVCAFTDVCVW